MSVLSLVFSVIGAVTAVVGSFVGISSWLKNRETLKCEIDAAYGISIEIHNPMGRAVVLKSIEFEFWDYESDRWRSFRPTDYHGPITLDAHQNEKFSLNDLGDTLHVLAMAAFAAGKNKRFSAKWRIQTGSGIKYVREVTAEMLVPPAANGG